MVHKVLNNFKIPWNIIDVLRLGYADDSQMRVVILITASATDTDPAKAQGAVDFIRSKVNNICGVRRCGR